MSGTPFENQVAAAGMSLFQPPRTFTITPELWAYDYQERPRIPVIVGLRNLTGRDVENAEAAAKAASHDPESHVYKRTLAAYMVARGICCPTDLTRPHPQLEMAEDQVPIWLSQVAIDAICVALADIYGPLDDEITDDDISRLGLMLTDDSPLAGLSAGDESMCRRALRRVLTALE